MKKHIPNTITLCNLLCGCIAVKLAFSCHFTYALVFILMGAVFDFFDGFSARKLGVSSPIGVELDSLADLITFGFAPTAMVYALSSAMLNLHAHTPMADALGNWIYSVNYIAFLVVAFSALRLANFNVDTRQTTSFIGLPTPANALLLASITITLSHHANWLQAISQDYAFVIGPLLLAAVSIVCSVMLVSEMPLFALKFKNFGWTDNSVRYIFIITSALLLIIMALQSHTRAIAGIGAVIVWYIILSLLTARKTK